MRILGISAFYHDSAAALVEDGEIVAAAQEERFTRKKHDRGLSRATRSSTASTQGGVDARRASTTSSSTTSRSSSSSACSRPTSPSRRAGFASFRMAMPVWLKEKLFQKSLLASELKPHRARRSTGRAAAVHRAPPEPRRQRLLSLAVRGGGGADHGRRRRVDDDLGRASGEGNRPRDRQARSTSRTRSGLLYSAFTYYTGFKVNSGEYKVMGLAPYGEPRYAELILDHLIDLKADGSLPARTCAISTTAPA